MAGGQQSVVETHGLDTPEWGRSWHGCPRPDEEFVCSVAEALEADDEVVINARSRTLTVLGYERQPNPGVIKSTYYPCHVLHLRGNGTEYRLRWSHTRDYYPELHTESQLETSESYSIKHGEPRLQTRATEEGERVHWIQPEGVEGSDVAAWALSRSVEVIE